MRRLLLAVSLLLGTLAPAFAQISINFGGPGVSIGINLNAYPTLQRVPGYPVYYAPGMNSNYFFYDGLYWVYQADDWYASSWYNGPWTLVDRMDVPVYLLRVPVRYYRHAPSYFSGYRADDAPRWGEHWGASWEQRHQGWDQWNRKSAPAPAPLPTYQRQYTGSRYPQASQQAVLESQNYRYQPRDAVAQRAFEQRRTQAQSAPAQRVTQQPQQQQRPQQQSQQQQQRPQQQQQSQQQQSQQQQSQQQQRPQQQQQQRPNTNAAQPAPPPDRAAQPQNPLERRTQQAPRTAPAPVQAAPKPEVPQRAQQATKFDAIQRAQQAQKQQAPKQEAPQRAQQAPKQEAPQRAQQAPKQEPQRQQQEKGAQGKQQGKDEPGRDNKEKGQDR
jgi:hypothetical protein